MIMIIVHFDITIFYQQIVEKKSFPRAITIVEEHLQRLWRNMSINTISVASIRGQIRRDINFFVSKLFMF
jgi:hypothetical protein